jgi:hypothetical protein
VIQRRAAVALAGVAVLAAGCGDHQPKPTTPTILTVTVPNGTRAGDVATAFSVSPGRAVTVAHVVGRHRTVLVAALGQPARRARVVRTDARLDLAVLAVPDVRTPVFATERLESGMYGFVQVVRGSERVTLHMQMLRRITAGVRDAPAAAAQVRPALELRTIVGRDDAGAPVLDLNGRVIGMLFAQAPDRDDRAYALDAKAFGGG